MYDELRSYIKGIMETSTGLPVSFVRAIEGADGPYITFDISENYSADIDRHVFTLTCDGWDHDTPKNLTAAFDDLDKIFRRYKANEDDFVIMIYNGANRNFVDDDDHRIRHMIRDYDMIVFYKE